MPFVADIIYTKKLCSRRSSSEVQFYAENGRFAFLSPPLGRLKATYDVHLMLIGKRVVDFLLVLIEALRRYERISIENWRFRSNRVSLAQNFR